MKDSSSSDAIVDILFGTIFCLGILVATLPQHVECWKARSAEGLSLVTLNVAAVCMISRFLSSLLEDSGSIIAAHGPLRTIAAAMPTLQTALMVFPGTPTYLIYYFGWYQKTHGNEINDETENECRNSGGTAGETPVRTNADGVKKREIISTVATLGLVSVIVKISVLGLMHPGQFHCNFQIKLWGGVGAATNAILWLPQIVKTWRLQSGGVLSLFALAFAAFGDLLLGAYWVAVGETFWVWGSLVSDSLMQMILMGMVIHYRRSDRNDNGGQSALREPLLHDNESDTEDPLGDSQPPDALTEDSSQSETLTEP